MVFDWTPSMRHESTEISPNYRKLTISKIEIRDHPLSGEISDRQAQREVVKIKKIWIFPTGLEVHLEDMF